MIYLVPNISKFEKKIKIPHLGEEHDVNDFQNKQNAIRKKKGRKEKREEGNSKC